MRDPYEKELDAECYAYAGMSYAEVLQMQENEMSWDDYRMAEMTDWEE